jgi:hypothetical protein
MAVQLEHVAKWERDRWNRHGDSDRWPDGYPYPRTCSYCGGAHPDDVVALVKAGWEVESTTKYYKRYLHPPGWREHLRRTLAVIRAGLLEGESHQSSPISPVPPVKVYVMHFSQEQIDAFNAAVKME